MWLGWGFDNNNMMSFIGGGVGGGAKLFSLQTQHFLVRLGCVEVELGL